MVSLSNKNSTQIQLKINHLGNVFLIIIFKENRKKITID